MQDTTPPNTGLQRTALCARKIAAILKLSIVATAFAIYRCAAAEAQTVGQAPSASPNFNYHNRASSIMKQTSQQQR
jgi:hypothetical protein